MTIVNATASDTGDSFGSSITVTVPATSIGNALVVIAAYATGARTVSTITGGATWSVAGSRLHDTTALTAGRIGIHAAICTAVSTSVVVTLSGASAGRVVVLELSEPLDPITEAGTSTDADTAIGTSHTAAVVTPTVGPVCFIAACLFPSDTGAWTEDADFTNVVTPNAASLQAVAVRFQSNEIGQGYTGTSANALISAVALACVRGAVPPRRFTGVTSGEPLARSLVREHLNINPARRPR